MIINVMHMHRTVIVASGPCAGGGFFSALGILARALLMGWVIFSFWVLPTECGFFPRLDGCWRFR